jgi:hypothetical protein
MTSVIGSPNSILWRPHVSQIAYILRFASFALSKCVRHTTALKPEKRFKTTQSRSASTRAPNREPVYYIPAFIRRQQCLKV